ncbi:MAG: family 10 glycosylhydrolase [Bacteroides sp.]|nr:family 10 glycosylhydrolase [Roseburia sp.]MCM1346348.1 family 10 glycosylhydrolase [Bacteroides sp.]MCM1420283.1 family 10 glycosylhydrolase [Bacteroides sp.]
MSNIHTNLTKVLLTTAIVLFFWAVFCTNVRAQNSLSNPQESIYSVSHPKHEIRAVWLATIGGIDWPRTKANSESGIERQKKELTDILNRLQQAHINTIILQTRIRGSVIYPSSYEPWDECLTGHPGKNPGYDPLAFAIEECHKRGMELHAWVVSIPLGKQQKQKNFGTQSIIKKRPSLCKAAGGEYFMIPGQDGTAEYIATICREIAEKYDVDGISLDYIRYPEKVYRFSDDNLYHILTKASKKQKASSGKNGTQSAHAPAGSLADWKRENITRIVRRVHEEVKATKPWIKLSSSPIGKYNDLARYSSHGWNCYNAVYQDPQAWLRDNIQDLLFPMMYFTGDNFFPFLFNWVENSYGHPVVPGLGIYFLDPREGRWQLNDVRAEMYASRQTDTGGIAFYRSDFLTRNCKGIYDSACEEFFPYPALQPRMSWAADTIAPPVPRNLRYEEGTLHWDEGTAGSTLPDNYSECSYIYYNVYGSHTYPVDITQAENLLATRVTSTSFELSGRSTSMRYFAVTSSDRFGNESTAVQENESMIRPFSSRALNPWLQIGTSGMEIGEFKFTPRGLSPAKKSAGSTHSKKRKR